MSKQVLGRGLSGIVPIRSSGNDAGITTISLNKIKPNKYQPRKTFNEESLKELAESIKEHGLAQPILVTPSFNAGEYEIIAGERRFRACQIAGQTEIKAIVRDNVSDKQKMELALLENMQREDLNPIEEALGLKRFIDEFQYTHEQISQKISKTRTVITNALRLLNLPKDIQELISQNKISAGHGRVLAGFSDDEKAIRVLVKQIMEGDLSVNTAERLAAKLKNPAKEKKAKRQEIEIKALNEKLQDKFRTKTKVSGSSKKGKIEIFYFSIDELERIVNELNIKL
jgi:ParB family chromosome partitioning protein